MLLEIDQVVFNIHLMARKITYLRDGRAPIPKNEAVSRVMRSNKGKNTQLELKFRKALRKAGLKEYKIHVKNLPGRPDVVFVKSKLAIFIDGCFWHGCSKCFVTPKSNRSFWLKKIQKNKLRDQKVSRQLRYKGWRVLRLKEHRLRGDISIIASNIFRCKVELLLNEEIG